MTTKKSLKTLAKATLGAIVVLLMGAMLIPFGAGAAPATASPQDSWAYGGSHVVNGSGTYTGPNGGGLVYTFHAYFGWAVVYNQTNTSATTYQIQATRATGVDIFLNFCSPNCSNPRHEVNLTAIAWEKDVAFANFTTNGTVYVSGVTPTTAVAVENEQVTAQANVTAYRTSSTDPNNNGYESVALAAGGNVAFQPALGLYPTNPVAPENWTATSNYTGQMNWNWAYHVHSPLHTGSGNVSGNISRSGSISLMGVDNGTQTLRGGIIAHEIGFQVLRGPFRFADGWFLLPMQADLFGGNGGSWQQAVGPAGAQLGTTAVDVSPGAGHFGMVAAASLFTPQASAPSVAGSSEGPASGAILVGAASGFQGTSVQAEPMSVSAGESLIGSVLTPYTPTSSTPSGGLGSHLGLFALVAGVVVVGVVVVAFVGMERSRPKRPVDGAVKQYRDAAVEAGGASSPKSSPTDTTEGGKDPLGYLR